MSREADLFTFRVHVQRELRRWEMGLDDDASRSSEVEDEKRKEIYHDILDGKCPTDVRLAVFGLMDNHTAPSTDDLAELDDDFGIDGVRP